jgi:membrane protein
MVEAEKSYAPPRIVPPLPKSAPLGARALRAVVRLGHGLWVHDATGAASSMAFNFFLSVIPLLVIVGFVLGQFIRRRGVDEFMGPLLDTVPATSADIIRHELERLAGASATSMAPLSAVGFLWLTSSGTHHVMDVFETAVHAPPRPWWKQRLIALAVVIAGLFAVCGTTWVLVEADEGLHDHDSAAVHSVRTRPLGNRAPGSTEPMTHVSRGHEPASESGHHLFAHVHAGWENWLAIGVMLSVAACGLAAFYRYAVEHPPGIRRRAWPGAFAALGVWLVASWGFGAYVISLGKYAMFYGSLAAVAVLLVWLWLTSLSLLIGAEVNAQLEGVRQ